MGRQTMVKPTTARPITAEPITIKQKPPLKLRHEWKHMVNPADDFLLANRLQKLFRHDETADSHGVYRVSSLYFDTPYDKARRQKLDGVNLREKFRLRYYGDDLSFIRLEKKFKINDNNINYIIEAITNKANMLICIKNYEKANNFKHFKNSTNVSLLHS